MKKRIATVSLAGCFGCHMSLLDVDEALLELLELVEFDRTPLNDMKSFGGRCDLGLVEGGCCNELNVHTLQEFVKTARINHGAAQGVGPDFSAFFQNQYQRFQGRAFFFPGF